MGRHRETGGRIPESSPLRENENGPGRGDIAPAMGQRFGPDARLRSRGEFKAVEAGGRRAAGRLLTLVGKPNRGPTDRLGIIASRRVGGAVQRNRAKRRLREVFRRRMHQAENRCLDLVVIARAEIVHAPFDAVQTDFLAALLKLRGAR